MSKEIRKSSNVVWTESHVAESQRRDHLAQKPLTLWFTGLSGAGKTTLGFQLEKALLETGKLAFVLDGDNVRHGLNRDLGFSSIDRSENIRRVAEVAKLMNQAGLIVIVSLISPFAEDRSMARHIIGSEYFREVYISTPLEVCEIRDPKGLYSRARAGEITGFTGVSSPYEAPSCPDVSLDTSTMSVESCISKLIRVIG
ncbi:adenylyl-sulfate kinase [Pseudomonas sp. TE50-2]|uniref:adenylyl-sulfate kinase n=1 Tax=Pseudomonas sp. TE50-2 TaxID=3142707 RepID=UPI003465CA79